MHQNKCIWRQAEIIVDYVPTHNAHTLFRGVRVVDVWCCGLNDYMPQGIDVVAGSTLIVWLADGVMCYVSLMAEPLLVLGLNEAIVWRWWVFRWVMLCAVCLRQTFAETLALLYSKTIGAWIQISLLSLFVDIALHYCCSGGFEWGDAGNEWCCIAHHYYE